MPSFIQKKVETIVDAEGFKNYIKTQTKNIRESNTDTNKLNDLAAFIDEELNSDMQKFAEKILSIALDKPISLDRMNSDYECAITIDGITYLRYSASSAYDSELHTTDPTDVDEDEISYATDAQIDEFFAEINKEDLERLITRFS